LPIEGTISRFLGNLNSECCRPSRGPQKGTSLRHNACFELLCVKIHPRVTSVGESREKENKKEVALYFTYFDRRSLTADWLNFGLRVRLVDLINCAKFYHNRLRGLVSVKG